MQRTHFIGTLLAALLVFGAVSIGFEADVSAQAQVKIAYVDLQRALNEVEEGKTAKAKLKKMFDTRQKKLDDQQNELKKFKDELQGKLEADVLSDDKKKELMLDYQKRFYELQTTYQKLQTELAKSEAEETKKIFDKMAVILKDIGLKEGYTIILEKTESSILWAPKSLDITDQLIQRYNAGK